MKLKSILFAVAFLVVSCASPRLGAKFEALELDGSSRSWAQLGLSGRLFLIQYTNQGNRMLSLDLASGTTGTVYQSPPKSWLSEAAVSPDGSQAVFAYTPPLAVGEISYGFTDLYLLPLDGSGQPATLPGGAGQPPAPPGEAGQPQPLQLRQSVHESFFHPAWSPDGQFVYYSHLAEAEPEGQAPEYFYTIEKINLGGEITTVVRDAFWPGMSPDGQRLAYLKASDGSSEDELYVTDLDGSQGRPVLPAGWSQPVDAHIFTQDGSAVIFSAVVDPGTPTSSWFDRLLGVRTAFAHDVPSDWFIVPAAGGEPERLTRLFETGLRGALSPDGRYLAFTGVRGLYVMDLESREFSQIVRDFFVGVVGWLP
jgi:Tol biopolymer transport system component